MLYNEVLCCAMRRSVVFCSEVFFFRLCGVSRAVLCCIYFRCVVFGACYICACVISVYHVLCCFSLPDGLPFAIWAPRATVYILCLSLLVTLEIYGNPLPFTAILSLY